MNSRFLFAYAACLPGILCGRTVWEGNTWGGSIQEAAFSAGANRVACAMTDGRMLVRDLGTGQLLLEGNVAPMGLTGVRISADGQRAVWGDVSGMLHSWSPADGMQSIHAGDMALTGLALTEDGTKVAVMGNGAQFRMRDAATFDSIDVRNPGLEQVHALAVDSSGNWVLGGDHSGRAMLVNRATGATQYGLVSESGLQGGLLVPDEPVELLLWDREGTLFFLDGSLNITGTLHLDGTALTSVIQDPLHERLIVSTRAGMVAAVSLETRALEGPALAMLEEPAAGLGIRGDGSLLALDRSGRIWRLQDGLVEEEGTLFAEGKILRAEPDLRTGTGTILTSKGGWLAQLSDGGTEVMDPGPQIVLLDAGIYHGRSGSAPVLLLLDKETMELRLTGESLPEEYIIDAWTPARVACGTWTPRIALMSADGETRVLEEGLDGFFEVRCIDPVPGKVFWDIAYIENDADVLRSEEAEAETFPGMDGPFQLEGQSGGPVRFSSIETHPAILAWPDLAPLPGGGMDAGCFGIIRATRDAWIQQREFGWGAVHHAGGLNYLWFAGEGWLAGTEDRGPFLYSYNQDNWFFTLQAEYPTDWLFDFSLSDWRRFGTE
ncbi:MAG: WD40 repeat domain-containing protein [Oceanipulchritudo sp.]